MSNQFFRLKSQPFGETPSLRFFFKAKSHLATLRSVVAAVLAGKGFALVTGEVGVGKTILSRILVATLGDRISTALILLPILDRRDLLEAICEEFKIPVVRGASFKELYDELSKFLLANAASGRRSVLVIDEAQRLSFEGLECIRLISNLETEERKLIQIVLLGQSELRERLESFELRQLNQRISTRFELSPLSQDEVGAYVRHRIEIAGGANFVRFDDSAMKWLARESGGIPRLINAFCERILAEAGAEQVRLIDAKFLRARFPGRFSRPWLSSWLAPLRRQWLVGKREVHP